MRKEKIGPLFCRLSSYGSAIERVNLLELDAKSIELRQTSNETVDAFTRRGLSRSAEPPPPRKGKF